MNLKAVLLFAVGLLPLSAFAQVMGNYAEQQRTYSNINFNAQYRAVPKAATYAGENVIEISINALSNQRADSYTAIFNVIQVGKTADETNDLINQRLEAMQTALRQMGIPEEDIYVDMVNFLPKYAYDVSKKIFSKKSYTEIPVGFEMQKNIHVRYRDPAQLGPRHRIEPPRTGPPDAGLRRPGAACANRRGGRARGAGLCHQHDRPAGLEADARILDLHDRQDGALGLHPDGGPGAGAEGARQRNRAGADTEGSSSVRIAFPGAAGGDGFGARCEPG